MNTAQRLSRPLCPALFEELIRRRVGPGGADAGRGSGTVTCCGDRRTPPHAVPSDQRFAASQQCREEKREGGSPFGFGPFRGAAFQSGLCSIQPPDFFGVSGRSREGRPNQAEVHAVNTISLNILETDGIIRLSRYLLDDLLSVHTTTTLAHISSHALPATHFANTEDKRN